MARLLASETHEEFNERWGFIAEHFDLLTSVSEHIPPLRQSILELAVRGKLTRREAGDEPKETKLSESIELISGQHILSGDYNSDREGTPYITGPADFGEVHPIISKWTNKPKVIALDNDILITVKGAGLGKLNIIKDGPIAISRQLMAIRTKPNLNQRYLYIFLKSKYMMFQASGVGIAIPGLSRKDINNVSIIIPPLAEQERIVKRVEQLLGWCDALEAQLKSAEEVRGRLVESVLAGVGES